jgi:DNA-binding transcriptional MerR regulator
MITIGQLAQYARVTTKAVRVYHQRGLLREPVRDASGYRRYGAQDAVDLVKIRTLARAGVPLSRIKDLLAAEPAEFDLAINEIDAALQKRVDQIESTRLQLGRLRAGEGLFASTEVVAYMDRLREIGMSERAVRLERDMWIFLQSVAPEQAAAFVADKLDAVGDPEYQAIYLEYDAAWDWSPEDPRLPALSDRSRRWFVGRRTGAGRTTPALNPNLMRVVNESVAASSAAWGRLLGSRGNGWS